LTAVSEVILVGKVILDKKKQLLNVLAILVTAFNDDGNTIDDKLKQLVKAFAKVFNEVILVGITIDCRFLQPLHIVAIVVKLF